MYTAAACWTSLCGKQTERSCSCAGVPLSQVAGQGGDAAATKPAAASAGSAARRPDYNPVAVTLEGCLHRFVRPESLGAHDRWICTRRAVLVRVVRAGVRARAGVDVNYTGAELMIRWVSLRWS